MTRDSQAERLQRGLEILGLAVSAATQERLLAFVVLLAKWNRVYNLTAVRDPDEMVTRHLLDSLVVMPYVQGPRVLDVGTGPGLPGLPLALVLPDVHFSLLDSNAKKTRFLTQAISELALTNVEVIRERVEIYRPPESFDTVVSRAFSSLSAFYEAAAPLCRKGGRLLAMKGAYPEEELQELPAGAVVQGVHRLQIPGLSAERHLVCLSVDPF